MSDTIQINVDVEGTTVQVVDIGEVVDVRGDYEKLDNLPKLNGRVFKGNVTESDPTVPQWAKSPTKPTYSSEDVGAVNKNNSITLTDLMDIINNIF